MKASLKKWMGKVEGKCKLVSDSWVDISDQFAKTSYVTLLKAVTNGEVVAIQITSKGAPDQSNIVTCRNSKYYLASGFSYFPLACFFMNYADITRGTNVAVLGNNIQLRCTSASTGSGGVQIGGVYPINKVGGVARSILKALQSLPYRKVVVA